MFIYFSRHGPFTLIYFSSTNHPVGDVCCLEVSRQKGLLTSFFSACFWASCKCRWRKRFTKLNKKGGLIRNAKTACWSSIGCAGSEAPVLLPESFSTMRVGCSSCPYPQLHRNVRDFHSKTLICPWLMSGRMPLVTAEKDWTTYAALVTSIPGLPVHGLLEERRDTTWLCLQ